MGRGELNQTFTKLIGEIGLEGRGARARPRPHDLRHAFAVHTLLGWCEAGEDIDRRMPLLSTYLGHYAGDPVKGDVARRVVRRSRDLAQVRLGGASSAWW